jgi:hypothetical protein
MRLPDSYHRIRQTLPVNEVRFGAGGIKLLTAEEITQGQLGNSPNGMSLPSKEEGAWKPSWVVIGYEMASGDALFIETAEQAWPVLTAKQGGGRWESELVAISCEAFAELMVEFAKIASGRGNPVELDANPLSYAERNSFLHRVDRLNENVIESSIWLRMTEVQPSAQKVGDKTL